MRIGVVWVPDTADEPGRRSPLAQALEGRGHEVISVSLPVVGPGTSPAPAVAGWRAAVAGVDVVVTTAGLARRLAGVVEAGRVVVVAEAVDGARFHDLPDRHRARLLLDLPPADRLIALTLDGCSETTAATVLCALRAMPPWAAVVLTAPGETSGTWWQEAVALGVAERVYDRLAENPVATTAACDVACVLTPSLAAAWSVTPAALRARACGLVVVDSHTALWSGRAADAGASPAARLAAAVLDALADDAGRRGAEAAARRVRISQGWERRAVDALDTIAQLPFGRPA